MSGAYFAGVGYVEDENVYDDIYIRRDTLDLAGQLISFDQNTQEIGVISAGPAGYVLSSDGAEPTGLKWVPQTGDTIAAGVPAAQTGSSRLTIVDTGPTTTIAIAQVLPAGTVGSAGQIPVITHSDTGQITAVATAPAVNAGASGAESAGSGLTITAAAVALANSGVAAGTYATATAVPQITVDARGRITAAANLPISFPAAADQLASVAVRSWGAGSARVVGVQDNVVIGDAAQITGQEAVAVGKDARAQTLGVSVGYGTIATAANCTLIGPLIRGGGSNSVFIGRNISGVSQTVASLNNVGIGNNILNALTSGSSNICIGGAGAALTSASSNAIIGTNAAPALTTSPNNVIIGPNTAANLATGIGRNVIIGSGSGTSTNVASDAVVIGRDASVINESISIGTLTQAQGVRAAAVGYLASAGSTNAIAIGTSARVDPSGTGSISIGNNITNGLANSCLIGNNDATNNFLVRTNGFFRSAKQLTCVAGQSAGDVFQVFPSPGPTLVQILSARFDNFLTTDGASSIDFTNNRLYLGQLLDVGSSFDVQVSMEGFVSTNSQWRINLLWSAPGVGLNQRIAGASEQTISGAPTGNCLSVGTTVNVIPGSTARNYMTFTMENLQGGGTFTVTNFRACITRYN